MSRLQSLGVSDNKDLGFWVQGFAGLGCRASAFRTAGV